MIIKKINCTGRKKLLLFFAGWGMDENLFSEYRPKEYDFMIVYNYTSLHIDERQLTGYEGIKIIAWSMGVWAASQFLKENKFKILTSIAINGTHFPIHDRLGIPKQIYYGTLKNLNKTTHIKFLRRMCGTSSNLSSYEKKKPQRSVLDLKNELKAIGELSQSLCPFIFNWEEVYISSEDLIFPTAHQKAAWSGVKFNTMDCPHYPEKLFKELLQ